MMAIVPNAPKLGCLDPLQPLLIGGLVDFSNVDDQPKHRFSEIFVWRIETRIIIRQVLVSLAFLGTGKGWFRSDLPPRKLDHWLGSSTVLNCAEMGPTGGGHDTETAHRRADHCRAQGRPVGHQGPGALPQTRHLGRHLL